MQSIKNELFKLCDPDYKTFHQKLIPNIDPKLIIGVRTPALKKYANRLFGTEECSLFLKELPHEFYEENNLHAFLINKIKDFDVCIAEVEKFLPFIDNWATCDGLRPISFKNNAEKLLPCIENWLKSDREYTVRFGIEMLMCHYLDEHFDSKYLNLVASVKSDKYYVNMMIAWYFATALAKQWDQALPYLKQNKLDAWIHNKTIQKAVESYRITKQQKEFLKALRQ